MTTTQITNADTRVLASYITSVCSVSTVVNEASVVSDFVRLFGFAADDVQNLIDDLIDTGSIGWTYYPEGGSVVFPV
jgi:hypothetical protein